LRRVVEKFELGIEKINYDAVVTSSKNLKGSRKSLTRSTSLRLRRYERIPVQNRRFRSNGRRLTQNFRYKGSPHQPFFCLEYKDKWCFVLWHKNLDRFFFRLLQSTCLRDGQTDKETELSSLDRVCIPCSAVKRNFIMCCLTGEIK